MVSQNRSDRVRPRRILRPAAAIAGLALVLSGCSMSSNGSGQGDSGGATSVKNAGPLSVGSFPYKNACNLMPKADVISVIGPFVPSSVSNEFEEYAESTVPVQNAQHGNIASLCYLGSFTRGDVTFANIELLLAEYDTADKAKHALSNTVGFMKTGGYKPISASDGTTVFRSDGSVEAVGGAKNVTFELNFIAGKTGDLSGDNSDTVDEWKAQAIQLTDLVAKHLKDGSIPSKARTASPINIGSTELGDVCTMLTAKLWDQVLAKDTKIPAKYRHADPSSIERTITYPYADRPGPNICERFSETRAKGDRRRASAEVSIYPYATAEDAQSSFNSDADDSSTDVQPLTGYGDQAITHKSMKPGVVDIEVLKSPYVVNVEYIPAVGKSTAANTGASDPGVDVLINGVLGKL